MNRMKSTSSSKKWQSISTRVARVPASWPVKRQSDAGRPGPDCSRNRNRPVSETWLLRCESVQARRIFGGAWLPSVLPGFATSWDLGSSVRRLSEQVISAVSHPLYRHSSG